MIKTALLAAGFAAVASIGSAQAQTVNLNFNGNGDTYTGLGAASDSGTVWNSAESVGAVNSATFSSLVNSTGGSSTVAVTLSDPTYFNESDQSVARPAAFANPLLSDQFYGGGIAIALSGLTPDGNYDLYLYAQNGGYNSDAGTYGSTFTFGTSKTTSNVAGDTSGFVSTGNYVEFAVTADVSGDITGTTSYALNGLQIQEVEVPEPSTMALLGLGALGFAFLAVRRRHSMV
jgi:hypothetical protein